MIFTPKGFLIVGGIVLVLIGLLGFKVIGPGTDGLFGSTWYFDNAENWTHLIIGLVGLIAAFALPSGTQKGLVMLVGIVALFFAVYNIFRMDFMGANLERPADLILHLVVGIWALMASRGKSQMLPSQPM